MGEKKTTTELDQRDQVKHTIPKPFKFVEGELKTEGWLREELAKNYERKMLKNLQLSDLVLQGLKLNLIDEMQGPVLTPASASNILERTYGIMQHLHEAGSLAEIFDVRKLLECDQDQITYACHIAIREADYPHRQSQD